AQRLDPRGERCRERGLPCPFAPFEHNEHGRSLPQPLLPLRSRLRPSASRADDPVGGVAMAGNWDGFCAMCASSDRCGTLHIARDGAGELQRVQVCTPCFALIAETLTAVVERPGGVASDLHV